MASEQEPEDSNQWFYPDIPSEFLAGNDLLWPLGTETEFPDFPFGSVAVDELLWDPSTETDVQVSETPTTQSAAQRQPQEESTDIDDIEFWKTASEIPWNPTPDPDQLSEGATEEEAPPTVASLAEELKRLQGNIAGLRDELAEHKGFITRLCKNNEEILPWTLKMYTVVSEMKNAMGKGGTASGENGN